MLSDIYHNLSKTQRIIAIIVIQLIIGIILIATINIIFREEKPKIEITNDDSLQNVPAEDVDQLKKQLWEVVSKNVDNADKSVINDGVVREGSYKENEDEQYHGAEFLLDIDSIKQTYAISIIWSDKEEVADSVYINCPPRSQSKYPESFCQGMYNNTNSLELYLPYEIASPYVEEYSYAGSDLRITGDEATGVITVGLNPCNNNYIFREKAEEYLQTIPNIEKYRIEYVVNDKVDVVCEEDL